MKYIFKVFTGIQIRDLFDIFSWDTSSSATTSLQRRIDRNCPDQNKRKTLPEFYIFFDLRPGSQLQPLFSQSHCLNQNAEISCVHESMWRWESKCPEVSCLAFTANENSLGIWSFSEVGLVGEDRNLGGGSIAVCICFAWPRVPENIFFRKLQPHFWAFLACWTFGALFVTYTTLLRSPITRHSWIESNATV